MCKKILPDKILYNLLYEKGRQFSLLSPDSEALGVMYPGKPLWLYIKDNWRAENVRAFFEDCIEKLGGEIPGLVAPAKAAEFCGSLFHRPVTGRWEIAALFMPGPAPYKPRGKLVSFNYNDIPAAAKWLTDFYREALDVNLENSENIAKALINGKKIYGLEVQGLGISAMGMIIPLPEGMCRLNLIYTPPMYRGRGFGKDITAFLAAKVQNEEKLPVLYARTASEPAMRLYKSLGFVEAGRLVELRFGME